ncbi:F-box protein At2g26850-like isoform X2 [Lotus japonicus]|uniref:F-box protein At2g26850-like isoform X2 n=1 Tax=Lotus japonicus TaxID=34305 RepID=UPI00258911E2|nr:F-box protein At2g26850-like isoform X2 [Lotus japonicus]
MDEANVKTGGKLSLLDLPEMVLDFILKCLSPIELSRMSRVCASLRNKCESDHLWEKHINHKWGRVIGDVAYKEWQFHITAAKERNLLNQEITNISGSLGSFTGVWPNLYLGSYLEDCWILNGLRSDNFMMILYFSLQSGRFWFPAQVYKGLMIHNALVNYDSESNNFQARYQSGGWRLLGKNLEWDMVRVPAVDSLPYVFHVSDCLDNLKPGDRIEIQWRGNLQSPYDWWYAIIGHLDSCNENENYCQCHLNDTLIVEFKQYPQGSNMRRIKLSRKNNGEQGDPVGGFYGGIRKLCNPDEIEIWMNIFSRQTQMAHQFAIGMPPVAAQFPFR